jgi:transposase
MLLKATDSGGIDGSGHSIADGFHKRRTQAAVVPVQGCQTGAPAARHGRYLEGVSRAEAGRRVGSDIQTVRDWVLRFNAEGPDGLRDRKPPGRPPKLTPAQQDALKDIAGKGPDPETDGVVRWRCKNLKRLIKERFGVYLDERNAGRLLRRLGFSYVSGRPRHPSKTDKPLRNIKKFRDKLGGVTKDLPPGTPVEIWTPPETWSFWVRYDSIGGEGNTNRWRIRDAGAKGVLGFRASP